MEKELINYIKSVLVFAFIGLLCGIFKNYVIIDFFDENIKNLVGISSYTSMTISLIFSSIILGVIGFLCFTINDICQMKIPYRELSKASSNFIYTLLLFEIIKVVLVVIVLYDELQLIQIDETFKSKLESTNWFYYNNLAEKTSTFSALFIFLASFKINTPINYKKLLNIIIMIIIIYGSLFISKMKWF